MPAAFSLLTFALIALWFRGDERASVVRRFLWLHLFAGALVVALSVGIVQPVAVVGIAALATAACVFARARAWQRAVAALAFLALAAAFMAHRAPGFANPRLLSDLRLTPDALPYSLHLNFDKPLIALFFLGLCHPLIVSGAEWRQTLTRAAPVAGGLILGLLLVALASGYVRFAPKFPAVSWLWLWSNLFFTCLAEEAVFRGLIQRELQDRWRNRPHGRTLAVGVAAVLFGLAHFAGGPAYVALATLAGLGYGWAYLRTGRIEAAVLTHFALNTVHFFGFTYPAVAP